MALMRTIMATTPAFDLAVRRMLTLLPEYAESLKGSPVPSSEDAPDPPAGVGHDDWLLALSALRAISTFAVYDDVSWVEDLRSVAAEDDVSAEAVDAVVRIVTSETKDALRDSAIRARDRLLPLLLRFRGSLDLRVAGNTELGHLVVPTVICRLEFDEEVGGGDGLAFQIPFRVLEKLTVELEALWEDLRWAQSIVPAEHAPSWVWPLRDSRSEDAERA
jgi:hypothetical protein